ncbi:class I SAM-dependent methyltransferase [Streptomyces sp. CT34]|uniref:class I SAM-dependent methyltransferase n=1 Tax=Streptomyces sp. CT34 TaxID=1553907 RepID=UPI0005B7C553|nr:class I SAM-dependent methyltransferase [Streptomyces sp. CT34]
MNARACDGSAGDVDYAAVGGGYAAYRQPDPRIAARIHAALGTARTVVNVGAGAGSYEATPLDVTAVEPSASMRARRPAGRSPAVDAVAEQLPFPDDSFDAAMTTFSVHQWSDPAAGLCEMRRVARGPVVVLTCDPALVRDFWRYAYAAEVLDAEARRHSEIAQLTAALGGRATVERVPIPLDCCDGFNEAYYGRPERLLGHGARQACSAWSFADDATRARFAAALRRDLEDGSWGARHGALRQQPFLEGSLVLLRAVPD